MARSLPSSTALIAFEAAARHCSFKKAAQELNITPSAISHQIKSLEDYLGVCLFRRTGKRLSLTGVAETFLDDVTLAFNILETASIRVKKEREGAILVINLFPALVSTWLLPKLKLFKEKYSDQDIRIVSSLNVIAFTGSEIDIAIRYAEEPPTDAYSSLLFEEEIFPVCSPKYLEQYGPFDSIDDLQNSTLIYCAYHPTEWNRWLDGLKQDKVSTDCELESNKFDNETTLGIFTPPKSPIRMDMDNRAQVIEAARNGLGFAMSRTPYADYYMASGELVAPFSFRIKTGMNYQLSWPERKAKLRHVRQFVDWFLANVNKD
jgi:LysR family glycine cleavage system transcriptional activator